MNLEAYPNKKRIPIKLIYIEDACTKTENS